MPSKNIIPRSFLVNLAGSFTINTLTCGSFVGFTGSCAVGPNSVNVTGTMGIS